jgi:uncharacterized protein (TIGR02271 family)
MNDDRHSSEAIPLVDEELRVEKVGVSSGKVRIRTAVDVIEETARASLEEETVHIERVPIGREIDVAPSVRTEGDIVIFPIVEEVLVVEKRLVLKEELHIRRRVTHETVEVPVTLRKERAVVERAAADGRSIPGEEKPV